MRSMKRQQGLSLIGVALLLFLIVFFGLLTVRMSGSYMDYFTLTKMIDTALDGQSSSRFEPAAFKDRISKNMEINNMSMNYKDSIKIDSRGTSTKITVDYENRVSLFLNIDVVMSFYKEYEL